MPRNAEGRVGRDSQRARAGAEQGQAVGKPGAGVLVAGASPVRALVDRFPTLRLAVPAEEVALRPETADIYGAKSLPVTWDG